jgi:Regulated-SNARE-like domain
MLSRDAQLKVVNIRYSTLATLFVKDTNIETSYSYLISDNVVFLTIADKSYPRKLAFSYLDELSKEFSSSYGAKVEATRKPYAFLGFGESP